MRRVACLLTLVVFGIGLPGCGGGGGGGKITGSVTMDGKPLADAKVDFIPGQGQTGLGMNTARTNAEGKFELNPDPATKMALKAGKYTVLIVKLVDKKGATPAPEDVGQLEASGAAKNLVPPRYNDKDMPVITVDIKPGENVLQPFEIKSKGK